MTRSRLVPLALAALILALEAACTGGHPGGPEVPPATGPATAARPSCDLAPASLVRGTLGIPIGDPTQTVVSTATTCVYPPAGGAGGVTVRMQTGGREGTLTKVRAGFTASGQPTSDVPDLFDEAFSSTLAGGGIVVNTLVARRGPVDILVTSSAGLDRERELITALFSSLGP